MLESHTFTARNLITTWAECRKSASGAKEGDVVEDWALGIAQHKGFTNVVLLDTTDKPRGYVRTEAAAARRRLQRGDIQEFRELVIPHTRGFLSFAERMNQDYQDSCRLYFIVDGTNVGLRDGAAGGA